MPRQSLTAGAHTLAGLLLLGCLSAPTTAQTINWVGGDGAWPIPTNWSGGNVPDSYAELASITNGSAVTVPSSYSIGGLTVGAADQVAIAPTAILGLASDANNDGLVLIGQSHLRLDGSLAFNGGGEVVLGPGGNFFNTRLGSDFPSLEIVLTNTAAHTIRATGEGRLGLNGIGIVNQGLIASSAGGLLYLDANAGLGGLVNSGVVRAEDGGTLNLRSVVDNTGGVIEGVGGGVVTLADGSVVDGGELGGSTVAIAGATLRDVTVSGSVSMMGTVYVEGTVVNNGSVFLGQLGDAFLTGRGDLTLGGIGEVLIDGATGSFLYNQIGGNSVGETFTNGAGHTIRTLSDARLGRSTSVLVNEGAVIADGPDADLRIDPTVSATTPFTNNGVVSARGGGHIFLSTKTDSTGGVLEAIGAGSQIDRSFDFTQVVTIGDVRAIDGGSVEVFTSNGGDQDLPGNAHNLEFTGASYTDIFAEGLNGELPGPGASAPGDLRSNQFSSNSGTFRIADGLDFTSNVLGSGSQANTGTIIAGDDSTFAMGFYGLNGQICGEGCQGGGASTVGMVGAFESTGVFAGSGTIANANAPGFPGALDAYSGPLFPNPVSEADIVSNGVISPGEGVGGIGTLTLVGDEIILGDDNVIELEIGPAGADQLVLQTTSEAVALNGELQITLLPGFSAAAGATLDLLTSGNGFTGGFDTLSLPGLAGGLDWVVEDGTASLSLTVVLGGDYNDDGVVDAADYTVWRANEGAVAGTLANDPVGGVIGAAQHDLWRANYGAALPATAAAAPEPHAVALLLLAAAAGVRRHRG